jgi:Bacterial Ig-like domain (group 2)
LKKDKSTRPDQTSHDTRDMQTRLIHLGTLTLAVAISALLACGKADGGPPTSPNLGTNPQGTGGDTSGNGTTGGNGQRPTGTVDSVSVVPASLTLLRGNYAALRVQGVSRDGTWLADQPATWKSSSPDVVAARDTGIVQGLAVGTAFVTATINGHSAFARVSVVAASAGAPPPPPPPPPPVVKFTLIAVVSGVLPATASDTGGLGPVAGAKVDVYYSASAMADSLDKRTLVTTGTTDATGAMTVPDLPTGWYRLKVAAPSGSPWLDGETLLAPPTYTPFRAGVVLRRR